MRKVRAVSLNIFISSGNNENLKLTMLSETSTILLNTNPDRINFMHGLAEWSFHIYDVVREQPTSAKKELFDYATQQSFNLCRNIQAVIIK